MSEKTFKILAIDGGGIRGVFPAYVLYCMSQRLDVRILDHVDMIAGTSTGSIIAAGIACNVEPERIVALYREKGPTIFSFKKSLLPQLPKKIRPGFKSMYDNKGLSAELKKVFNAIKLGEITTPLLLPATDIGYGGVHVFKSGYSKEFTRDKNVLVREAVMASCSAPTFFNPLKVGEYLLADGGLWANNPSLAAVIDAQRRLNIPMTDIQIFSLGTGHAKTSYGVKNDRKWGLLRGWKGPEFISFLMSLQAQSTHNYLQLMLKPEQLLRIDFESDMPLPLDDCSAIDDLISRADREFTYRSADIKKFFNLE